MNLVLIQQNEQLLNRLQSPDLQTFLALQSSSTPDSNSGYIPQDDESEALRLAILNGQGVGESTFIGDDEIKQYSMRDFGFDFDPLADRP